jgi:ankyrin repeat protein
LDWACLKGAKEIVTYLLENNLADPKDYQTVLTEAKFHTPLQLAAREGYSEIVEILVTAGFKINGFDSVCILN